MPSFQSFFRGVFGVSAREALRRSALSFASVLFFFAFVLFSAGCGGLQEGLSAFSVKQAGAGARRRTVARTQTASPPAPEQPSTVPSDPAKPEVKLITAAVARAVDGDTVYVNEGGRSEKVRFIGVDTPESTTQIEPYGKEAAAYTARNLAGRKVYLELDVQQRDKYGRLLAYV